MQDAEICALIAPRTLTLEMGLRDNLFDYRKSQDEFERLKPYYEAFGASDKLHLAIVDTDHKFSDLDQIIDRLMDAME